MLGRGLSGRRLGRRVADQLLCLGTGVPEELLGLGVRLRELLVGRGLRDLQQSGRRRDRLLRVGVGPGSSRGFGAGLRERGLGCLELGFDLVDELVDGVLGVAAYRGGKRDAVDVFGL